MELMKKLESLTNRREFARWSHEFMKATADEGQPDAFAIQTEYVLTELIAACAFGDVADGHGKLNRAAIESTYIHILTEPTILVRHRKDNDWGVNDENRPAPYGHNIALCIENQVFLNLTDADHAKIAANIVVRFNRLEMIEEDERIAAEKRAASWGYGVSGLVQRTDYDS